MHTGQSGDQPVKLSLAPAPGCHLAMVIPLRHVERDRRVAPLSGTFKVGLALFKSYACKGWNKIERKRS